MLRLAKEKQEKKVEQDKETRSVEPEDFQSDTTSVMRGYTYRVRPEVVSSSGLQQQQPQKQQQQPQQQQQQIQQQQEVDQPPHAVPFKDVGGDVCGEDVCGD